VDGVEEVVGGFIHGDGVDIQQCEYNLLYFITLLEYTDLFIINNITNITRKSISADEEK
jgi:hypothetical protein